MLTATVRGQACLSGRLPGPERHDLLAALSREERHDGRRDHVFHHVGDRAGVVLLQHRGAGVVHLCDDACRQARAQHPDDGTVPKRIGHGAFRQSGALDDLQPRMMQFVGSPSTGHAVREPTRDLLLPVPPAFEQGLARLPASGGGAKEFHDIRADADGDVGVLAAVGAALPRCRHHQAALGDLEIGNAHADDLGEPRSGCGQNRNQTQKIAVPVAFGVDLRGGIQHPADIVIGQGRTVAGDRGGGVGEGQAVPDGDRDVGGKLRPVRLGGRVQRGLQVDDDPLDRSPVRALRDSRSRHCTR